ncbi:MAG: hypothetical protein ACE367_20965 [Acidimicrobiales bacterium]
MTEQTSNHPAEEPLGIVWWPWIVLAAGPALAALLAALDDDPTDGDSSILALVVVGLLALLFLGVIFAPALLLISRNADAPDPARGRAAFIFVVCVVGAHVVGQLIDRLGPDDGESSLWALAFIGTYAAASVVAWRAIGQVFSEAAPEDR